MDKEEILNEVIKYTFSNLNKDEDKIYAEAIMLYPKEIVIGTVLSILCMKYPKNIDNPVKNAIETHKTLYEPFYITKPMCWTFSKIFDIDMNNIIDYCKKEYWELCDKDVRR